MRFTYAEAMTQATFYAPLAQAAEAAGYTSMTVADSLIYPQESDSKYPYTDTGDREGRLLERHEAPFQHLLPIWPRRNGRHSLRPVAAIP